jgi:NADH-quinone oxidoreductase subunit N
MPDQFSAPHLEYWSLLPMLVVFGAALVGVLVEAFVPRALRYVSQVIIALLGIVVALVFAAAQLIGVVGSDAADKGKIIAEGAIAADGVTLFLWVITLTFALLSVLLMAERRLDGGVTAFASQAAALPGTTAERQASARHLQQTEVFPLVMFAIGGMLMFPAANDLLTMFVGLEVLSLPLYLLCGLARRRRLLSQESAMKYFLLGAFSSAFFVFGSALLYGYAGSVSFSGISLALAGRVAMDPLLIGGMALVSVGLLFKVSAAPFHVWTPDVYQGAPTSITAFMAACTKVAAFGALLRLFYVALGAARVNWTPVLWIVAALTMLVGSILALSQSDVKRLLAYSSIAHAGFLLVGFAAVSNSAAEPTAAVLFYLATYGFATIGAFAIVMLVRNAGGEATHLSHWAGLAKTSPLVAASMTLFMLAFAGIPLTSGFMGKWAVFSSAWTAGGWPLVLFGVLASVIAAGFYLRVIVVMYFSRPAAEGPVVAVPSLMTTVTIAVGVVATVVLGIVPGPVMELATKAASFVG